MSFFEWTSEILSKIGEDFIEHGGVYLLYVLGGILTAIIAVKILFIIIRVILTPYRDKKRKEESIAYYRQFRR